MSLLLWTAYEASIENGIEAKCMFHLISKGAIPSGSTFKDAENWLYERVNDRQGCNCCPFSEDCPLNEDEVKPRKEQNVKTNHQ